MATINRVSLEPIDILLVEDNEPDIELTKEALLEGKIKNTLQVVMNGEDALSYLNQEGEYANQRKPDIILLDLNLPKKSGFEVLEEMSKNPELKRIPVVVLTTSDSEKDILRSYDLNANCYITKPVDFNQFISVVKSMEEFWFQVVKLPSQNNG